jgi:diguanylate cyclase (GGDEF)-like protein
MDGKANKNMQAAHQLPKLKSLLKKYRQLKTMQSGLLKLSELASTVTDMTSFYSTLESVIKKVLISDSFHIALQSKSNQLTMAYCHNPQNILALEKLEKNHWQNSLTHLVFEKQNSLHFTASQCQYLAKTTPLLVYDQNCVEWLGVPLKRGSLVIGVLVVKSYDEKLHFDQRDCELLDFIAGHLVTAIDRVRSRELLEDNIRQRTRILTETNEKLQQEIAERQKAVKMHKALLAISEITACSKEINRFYQIIHQKVAEILPSKNIIIALLSDNKSTLEFPYYQDEMQSSPQPRKQTYDLTQQTLKMAKPLLITKGYSYSLLDDGQLEKNKCQLITEKKSFPNAWLASPLVDRGEVFGVLALQHYQNDDAFTFSDLELIRFVSQHIASVILRQNAQLKVQKSKDQLANMVNKRTEELQATNFNLRREIEERRKAEQQLYFEAHHDALTRLPNRAMFSERLSYALSHLKRHPNNRFAVLFIDLDRFKTINDTLGHFTGDQFLIEIASRLSDCVRDNDVLARLGGDEFVILLDSVQSAQDVEDVASRIINMVRKPFSLEGHTLYSNASIGVAPSHTRYKDASEILRDADAAMYQAKNLGRGRYVFFDESMREQLMANITLEQELRIALKEQQFELHYQKISELSNHRTIGYEGLLRWHHPDKGLLTPSEFLFMAEETGMIVDIEAWVVKEVCLQLKYWKNSEENKDAFIGINLSGRYLSQPNQINELISVIREHVDEPNKLILEFNESAFSQHKELVHRGIKKLTELGIKLALDDYGTRMSSFNLLHSYPFEFIKLDRSFTRTLDNDDKKLALVKALNGLGDEFGYQLVAEGIESEAMFERLQKVGCQYGQGYYISRPAKIETDEKDVSETIEQARA